jgi:hypothetical protein
MPIVDGDELQTLAKQDLSRASREEVARQLGVYPPVIERYVRESQWPVERSLAVLRACGKEVKFQVA